MTRGPNAVLAFLGNVGTPTMVRAAPVAIETGTIYFGAFTGADKILRDTTAGAVREVRVQRPRELRPRGAGDDGPVQEARRHRLRRT